MSVVYGRKPSSTYSCILSTVCSKFLAFNPLHRPAQDPGPEHRLHQGSFSVGEPDPTISTVQQNTENKQALVPATQFGPAASKEHMQSGGVDWDIAGTGVRLWLSARGRAEMTNANPALLRSMHIDAVRYMNMGLPKDLSQVEVESLRASLPTQLHESDPTRYQLFVASKPNVLRQGIAIMVCWMVALLLMIIPLLMTIINKLLIYERKHRVAYRVLSNSAELTKALGERSLELGDTVARYKDTHLGRLVLDTMSWFAEGIMGGLNDGLVQSTSRYSQVVHR